MNSDWRLKLGYWLRHDLHSEIASVPFLDVLVVLNQLGACVIFAMRLEETVNLFGVVSGLLYIQVTIKELIY